MIDERLRGGIPPIEQAYDIGKNIKLKTDEYHQRTGGSLHGSNEDDFCLLFVKNIDSGMTNDEAWSDALSYYEYISFQEEM